MKLKTNLEFGAEYKDKNTQFVGRLTGIYFYEFGCTRATLVAMGNDGHVVEATFDEQALLDMARGEAQVEPAAVTGGPREAPPRR